MDSRSNASYAKCANAVNAGCRSKTASAVTISLVLTLFFAFAPLQAQARWYDPERGLFLSKDPIGRLDPMTFQVSMYIDNNLLTYRDQYPNMLLLDRESHNMYSFVENDPINFVDPAGLTKSRVECTVKCNVQVFVEGTKCPSTTIGSGSSKNECEARKNAYNDATTGNKVPEGCYPRHCSYKCKKH